MVSWTQAARQAAQEKKAEASQVAAPPPAAEAVPDPSVKKLPVGNTVSSVHVNYNYFEVGTGQVNDDFKHNNVKADFEFNVIFNYNFINTLFCRCQWSTTLWTLSQ